MDCLEIIVTIDWVESCVIGELLLGDCFLGLQTKNGIDVFLLLDIRKCSPSTMIVSIVVVHFPDFSMHTIPFSREGSCNGHYAWALVVAVQEQCEGHRVLQVLLQVALEQSQA